jgi:hypothetical protein
MPATTTMADAIEMVRARIGETNAAFWVDSLHELCGWIDDGVREQHRRVLQKWLADGGGAPSRPFLQFYGTAYGTVTTTGVQDYALPQDFAALIQLDVNDYRAFEMRIAEEYFVKTYPQFAPTPEQPRYAFKENAQIRVYVEPGSYTVPVSTVSLNFRYFRKPTAAGTAGTVDCPDEYLAGPIDYAAAKCLTKAREDPTVFWNEFKAEVEELA